MSNQSLSFTFRPPVDLLQALEEKANITGGGRSAIVIEALRLYFNQPEPDGSISPLDLKRLTDRLDSLEEQLQTLKMTQRSESYGDASPKPNKRIKSKSPDSSEAKPTVKVEPTKRTLPAVTSLTEAIAALLDARATVKYNNAGQGPQAIKRVLAYVRDSGALPLGVEERIVNLLDPDEVFQRNKARRVRSAIDESLVLLQALKM